jgi:pyruvate/2-oxoglutarate dehydrogenase complex dihydrolipoamide acyltransferase (E2) component
MRPLAGSGCTGRTSEALEIRATLRRCLAVDHQVPDSRPAAEFLMRIVEWPEAPKALADDGASA